MLWGLALSAKPPANPSSTRPKSSYKRMNAFPARGPARRLLLTPPANRSSTSKSSLYPSDYTKSKRRSVKSLKLKGDFKLRALKEILRSILV